MILAVVGALVAAWPSAVDCSEGKSEAPGFLRPLEWGIRPDRLGILFPEAKREDVATSRQIVVMLNGVKHPVLGEARVTATYGYAEGIHPHSVVLGQGREPIVPLKAFGAMESMSFETADSRPECSTGTSPPQDCRTRYENGLPSLFAAAQKALSLELGRARIRNPGAGDMPSSDPRELASNWRLGSCSVFVSLTREEYVDLWTVRVLMKKTPSDHQ